MSVESILEHTEGIPISLNKTCKILHRGKKKVKSLLNREIDLVEQDGSWGYNLADVLRLCGKNL